MLKRKIDAAAYAALPDAIKAEYQPKSDGYVLDTDDARELISARDAANGERDTIKAQLTAATTKITELEATRGADTTTLENSYKAKIAAKDTEIASLNTKVTGLTKTVVCGPEADKIASKFSAPTLIRDRILARLDVDPKTEKPRVLDAEGKASASTLDDLAKEFVDNPDFKAIVIGSKATGSATPHAPGGSAPNPPVNSDGSSVPLSKQTPAQIAAHLAAKKAAAAPS